MPDSIELDPKTAHIDLQVIGRIHTPFTEPKGTPIQPVYSEETEGRVIVHKKFLSALTDLQGFDRIWLIYWMHQAGDFQPKVVPYRDTKEHGLFATRAPTRPNRIGMSVVRLIEADSNLLLVSDVDMLDGSPLLDIKPYVPEFDSYPDSKAGWLESSGSTCTQADDRFH